MSKFQNKDGSLTAYAFACGYSEKAESSETFKMRVWIASPQYDTISSKVDMSLWHEGACYHVRAHNHEQNSRIFWESFDKLTDARRFFRSKKKELGLR